MIPPPDQAKSGPFANLFFMSWLTIRDKALEAGLPVPRWGYSSCMPSPDNSSPLALLISRMEVVGKEPVLLLGEVPG